MKCPTPFVVAIGSMFVSGSIAEIAVSPVKQNIDDVVPDIGCANHDYSCCSFNSDSR